MHYLCKETNIIRGTTLLATTFVTSQCDLTIAASITGIPGKSYSFHSFSSKGSAQRRHPQSRITRLLSEGIHRFDWSLSSLFKRVFILVKQENVVNEAEIFFRKFMKTQ